MNIIIWILFRFVIQSKVGQQNKTLNNYIRTLMVKAENILSFIAHCLSVISPNSDFQTSWWCFRELIRNLLCIFILRKYRMIQFYVLLKLINKWWRNCFVFKRLVYFSYRDCHVKKKAKFFTPNFIVTYLGYKTTSF